MIISRTPLRISFAGGGSDIEDYYKLNQGAVVSTAINKYIYITVNKKFDRKIRVSYSRTETVDNIDEIQHELVRESLRLLSIKSGIEITSISDVPSQGTGLGSSSSYTVGLLNALHAYKSEYVSSKTLAEEACKIEIDILRKPIGKQDQYISALGGMKFINFNKDGSVFVDPIICLPRTILKLQKNLLMFYTGLTRSANVILEKQRNNLSDGNKRNDVLKQMVNIAFRMRESLIENKLDFFGRLLYENWKLKKSLAKGISNRQIELWYIKAIKAGALGGKICGAGGGGFLLFYVKQNKQDLVKKALSDLSEFNFCFEPQGSKVIYIGE